MVDGITATDVNITGTGSATGPLNFSSIKEVKIITNNFNAEYGRDSSSQVLYITKGGTNEFHGEMYDYLQNDKLNARAFFDRTGKPVVVRQNQYGFEVGGPVFIPKLFDGRNKLFWHVDYEGLKRRGVSAPVIANLPTPAQLATITDPTSLAIANQYKLPSSPTGTTPFLPPTPRTHGRSQNEATSSSARRTRCGRVTAFTIRSRTRPALRSSPVTCLISAQRTPTIRGRHLSPRHTCSGRRW